MFVGGEFYYDQAWLGTSPAIPRENMVFLNGGRACLTVISDFLLDHGIGKVLLPAYLCPSIVETFQRCRIAWDFYQIHEDLSIDLDDLARKITRSQAVYFINYFGFFHNTETLDLFKSMQQDKIFVIEDNAQAGFPDHQTGDFIFNSMRKLAAYDGGYLITPHHDMLPYLDKYQGLPNRRLPLIRQYRERLYHYLYDKTGSYPELVDLFQRATQYYETDQVILGDPGEFQQIERLDWQGIRQIRRDNFRYLMHWVSEIPEITPIFSVLQADNMPFGLPVYFSPGGARDRVYAELGKAGIGLTIHWEDICSDPRTNQNHLAVDMAGRMLTLSIDQRIRHKQLDYLAINLIGSLGCRYGNSQSAI
jgi:dTDP-4-amino-4,6-dideoxygalactose transaminase